MTMSDSEKVKMTLNIGGEHIALSVDFNQQDAVREAEKAASDLFNTWRRRFPVRTDKEIMAMVAYQFAYYYGDLLQRYEAATETAAETEALLSGLIGSQS